ncbi:winged helix DNA-binding domain-containing protein [Xylanimonas sp. McL0601]|uniref:winged helix DNA-binding domain-containing protein n=1 Tax=Xylanimonas sp. McL0601 TaxID=3414739 RepID=UPI003CF95B03
MGRRRTRLARRHLLAAGTATSVEQVNRALVCLHATDPATVYLSACARLPGFTTDQLDRALYVERTLVKHLAMRRTLFLVDREDLPDVQAAASDRVAGAEARKMIRMVEADGIAADGAAWLRRAEAAVLAALADGRQAASTELKAELPILQGTVRYGAGRWSADLAIAPRVLTILSAQGRVVRATNRGDWATSRPRWATAESWLGSPVPAAEPALAHRRMVERWLRRFGPGTADDLRWWLGSTVTAVRRSLADLGAVEVGMDGRTGYVLPDDVESPDDAPPEPWVALLPALDPSPMGWTDRDWYVGEHGRLVYDSAGNAGPTVWSDGRIVGGWWQDPEGAVVVRLLDDVGREAAVAIDAVAERLTAWLDGRVVLPRFPSPLARLAAG